MKASLCSASFYRDLLTFRLLLRRRRRRLGRRRRDERRLSWSRRGRSFPVSSGRFSGRMPSGVRLMLRTHRKRGHRPRVALRDRPGSASADAGTSAWMSRLWAARFREGWISRPSLNFRFLEWRNPELFSQNLKVGGAVAAKGLLIRTLSLLW